MKGLKNVVVGFQTRDRKPLVNFLHESGNITSISRKLVGLAHLGSEIILLNSSVRGQVV